MTSAAWRTFRARSAISSRRTASSRSCPISFGKGPTAAAPSRSARKSVRRFSTLTPDDVNARLDAAMAYGKRLPAVERQDRRHRVLLGRGAQFRLRRASRAERRGRLLRRCAGLVGRDTRDRAREREGAGARPLCRQRRADRRDGAGDRSRDEGARQEAREVHTFEGAGHGFMGNQAGADGANLKAPSRRGRWS